MTQAGRLDEVLAVQLERRRQRILKAWDERRVTRAPDGTFTGWRQVDETLSTAELTVFDARRARSLEG